MLDTRMSNWNKYQKTLSQINVMGCQTTDGQK